MLARFHSTPTTSPAGVVRFALNLDNGRGEMDVSGLVKLDLAATRLDCHVKTLRIRVRDGRLPAVRARTAPTTCPSRRWLRCRHWGDLCPREPR